MCLSRVNNSSCFLFFLALSEVQKLTKESLKIKYTDALSNAWLPEDLAHHFSLRKYYTGLSLVQTSQRGRSLFSREKPLKELGDIFRNLGSEPKAYRILLEGRLLSGKT